MFGGEHKQTDIAQSAIFTTGSMRASRLYPTIFLTLLILYGDYSFDMSSKIRVFSSYIFSPFFDSLILRPVKFLFSEGHERMITIADSFFLSICK